MNKNNPKISQRFLREIKNQKTKVITIEGIKIKTCKNVFPPRSNFSRSSEKLHVIFNDLKGLLVLDVGTGTGVQAIQAVLRGAQKVIGLDINPSAVSCAKENVILNNLGSKVTILKSDLFVALKVGEKFDVMIANLPVSDFPIVGIVESSLYDPGFKLHKRFFGKVGNYLTENGVIIMTHVNFKGEKDFDEFENMLGEYGYIVDKYIEIEDLGYLWRMYRIKRV